MHLQSTRFLVPALLLAAAVAFAEDAPKKDEAPVAQIAVFKVPNVGDEAVVKDLTKALAKQEGLLAAKADAEAGTFLITFETAKTNADALTAIVTKVSPESKLDAVRAADASAAGHDCGKCPAKDTCGKTAEHEGKEKSKS